MKFVVALSLLIVNCLRNVTSDSYPECDNLPEGAFIGGTQGCRSYIYCDGEDSYEGFCPSQLLFSTKDGSCAPASDVDCEEDIPSPTTTTTTTTTTTIRSTTTTTTTSTTTPRPPPTSTTAPEEDYDVEISEEDNKPDIESPTNIESTKGPSSSSTTHLSTAAAMTQTGGSRPSSIPRPLNTCPTNDIPDEVIFIPSDHSCSEYFVCYHGSPVPMYCSGQLYFDKFTSKCDLPERVNCMISAATTSNPKKECTINTFDYFPYPKNCNYFYKCINGFLSLQQCPIGFGWSDEMKLCLKLDQGRCPIRGMDLHLSQAWLSNVFSR